MSTQVNTNLLQSYTAVSTPTPTISGTSGNDTLIGTQNNDVIDGGAGIDILVGGLGNDSYYVDNIDDIVWENNSEGTDTVYSSINYTIGAHLENLTLIGTAEKAIGNSLNNTMTGNASNNILDGWSGADTMIGGLGNDKYIVENANDVVVENANEGTDTIETSISYTLSANVETLKLMGTAAINGSGNDSDNTIGGNSGNNSLYGLAGNDNIYGKDGNDYIDGGVGNDTLYGDNGADTLIGGTGNDNLYGGDGDDKLDGSVGADNMSGNLGNDTYTVDNIGDIVNELVNQGTDSVISSIDYTLTYNVENLTLTGSALKATGNALNNTIIGNASSNTIDGCFGVDTMIGGDGNDTYYVDNINDLTNENVNQGTDSVIASVDYTLGTNVENLTLTKSAISATGNDLNNVIIGTTGNNIINGGAGADTLKGGIGNDTYYVDNAGDVVTENLNEGTDTVVSSIDYTLIANLENLTLNGSALKATGNSLNNVITGNNLNNTLDGGIGNDALDGGTGADTMIGGVGNDTFSVDNAGDIVTENLNEGTDTVVSSIDYTLIANLENLTLNGSALNATGNTLNNVITGNSLNNTLDGGIGDDTLNGGTGADTMIGGTGNDFCYIDNAGDIVTENLNEGTDTVVSSIDYTLGANLENLILIGTALRATGNSINNNIIGNDLNNILNGGTGADTMAGGKGNDTYYVDNASDVVVETNAQGTDTVSSSINYTLGAHVENLTITGSALNATGNSFNNTITGNASNNRINGWTGVDTMIGGLGNDTYVVDNVGDIVTENTNEGFDTIETSISYTLSANVEKLVLSGTSAINGAGNDLDNTIGGNSANNTLTGNAGLDTIYGKEGNDTIDGGAGADVLYGDAGSDTLTGGTGNDKLYGGDSNDTYVFNKGDNIDTISETLGTDTVKFGSTVAKAKIAVFKDSTGKLTFDYGDTAGVDQVNITNWNATNNQVEKVQLSNGTYISNININLLIQQMTSYAANKGIHITSVNDVKANQDLMTMISNSWHA